MTTDEVIKHFGNIKEVAKALDIWPQVIYTWGEHPPMARQYELEVKTDGKLKAEVQNG